MNAVPAAACVRIAVEQAVGRVAIELGRRLVGDDDRRVPRERQREGRARLLAAGELGRVRVEPVLDPEGAEELERLVVGVLALLGERQVGTKFAAARWAT